jgi:hypothetical protein
MSKGDVIDESWGQMESEIQQKYRENTPSNPFLAIICIPRHIPRMGFFLINT